MNSYRVSMPPGENQDFEKYRHRFEDTEKGRAFLLICETFGFEKKKILDIGCSYGEFLIHAGNGSVGVSVSEYESNFCKALNLDVVVGDIQDPMKIEEIRAKGPYDVIWANNIFEHLESPHLFLRAITRLADKDTIFILGVPVFPRFKALMRFAKFRGSLATSHINFFTLDTLAETVRRAGWNVEVVRPFVLKQRFADTVFSSLAPHQYVIARKLEDFVYPEKRINEVRNKLADLYFDP